MTYELRDAQRGEAKPLIGLYSESGAGKTYSALLLARGFVGPKGRIAMIETESGRGEAYADPAEYPELAGDPPGKSNYLVVSLRDRFSPRAYGEAMTACEAAKVDALIIDSASHEWEASDGVLGMAGANMEDGKKGVQVWHKPKNEHKMHFMLRFMQSPIPLVILCMRAKYRMVEIVKEGGGKEWSRSENLDPIQADDILFEMFIHGWIEQGTHAFQRSKCTAKALEPVFGGNRPITLETGQQLAAWAKGQAAAPAKPAADTTEAQALDNAAAQKAEEGTVALQAWWKGLTGPQKRKMKAAMDTRHKPRAAEVDAAANGAQKSMAV